MIHTWNKKDRCPYCQARVDDATLQYGGNDGPKPGDLNICAKCAEISVLDEDLSMRKIQHDDWAGYGTKFVIAVKIAQKRIRAQNNS